MTQQIRAERVQLPHGKKDRLELTCLVAQEIGAPSGVKRWCGGCLLTNRHADTLEQAVELINWHRARWEIELFFLILKEGYRVGDLQLSRLPRVKAALALYLVIAWRVNRKRQPETVLTVRA